MNQLHYNQYKYLHAIIENNMFMLIINIIDVIVLQLTFTARISLSVKGTKRNKNCWPINKWSVIQSR